MTLIDRLPDLTDAELANLLTNARRLSEGEDEKRRAAAESLLPALEQQSAARATARAEALAAARAARTPARRKAA